MPTYEYECNLCDHRFEQFQSIKDKPLKKCPKCGGKVERLLGTGAGLLFKGSGFYITDNRSSEYRRQAKSEAGGTPAKAENKSTTSEGGKK
ncbi:MAG: zinc ribbon domain-containing protein [Candidatus Edwardsbacteria bacterium]|nr:zinc ribbon domain-containing protein [Candidatus Edwardsbacteria bacterium]MBU1577724.1 zinc ribbon domain-containing protein [Candidatus Edwardsbacteria bacterium]MBU2464249.1 zinc ribbon domain-containing protein [Candidatus Edwardsbacteria bacterium]MBU2593519.1 zinc ribbon domain-containing protein [Candidatus Edwardsbacteria bacterium]